MQLPQSVIYTKGMPSEVRHQIFNTAQQLGYKPRFDYEDGLPVIVIPELEFISHDFFVFCELAGVTRWFF